MKLVLLWLTLIVSILFLFLPYSEDKYSWFPMSDQTLSLAMHLWFICEKLVMVVLAWIILSESQDYKVALLVFFGIQVLKLGDYFVCYNDKWGEVLIAGKLIPLSANTIGAAIFTFSIMYEFAKLYANER